jgi:phage tail sheath gpL-like
LALYRDFEARGWVEDYEGYRQSLIVERDADRSRMNYRDVPNLINQLRVVAGKTQFKN